MAIEHIDHGLCDGCSDCVKSCPADVIRLIDTGAGEGPDTWKAVVAYPQECHSCSLCEMDCHVAAIRVSKLMALPRDFITHEGLRFPKLGLRPPSAGRLET